MQRRAFIRRAVASAAVLSSSALFAQTRPLRVLILGGTGFIGPHFVTALRAGGHKVTLFNRGRRAAALPADIESLTGDRNGQIDALRNRPWDAVIDNSGYTPRQVQLSVDA